MPIEIRRNANLAKYWPRVIGDMRDFGQIANGENPEFNLLWGAVERFLGDVFVMTATEYAIERWEFIFGLETYTTDTLDQRRARILAATTRQLPYTMRSLRIMVESLIGAGNYMASVDPVTMTLEVLVNVRAAHMMEDVQTLLDAVVPANLTIVLEHLYSPHEILTQYTHT